VGVPGRRWFETLLRYTLANARGLVDIGVWDTAASRVTALAPPRTVALFLA